MKDRCSIHSLFKHLLILAIVLSSGIVLILHFNCLTLLAHVVLWLVAMHCQCEFLTNILVAEKNALPCLSLISILFLLSFRKQTADFGALFEHPVRSGILPRGMCMLQ